MIKQRLKRMSAEYKNSLRGSALFLSILLASCAHYRGYHNYIGDASDNYLKSKSVPALQLPPGYDHSKIYGLYEIPDSAYQYESLDEGMKRKPVILKKSGISPDEEKPQATTKQFLQPPTVEYTQSE